MSDVQSEPRERPTASDVKPFVGSKDFETSKDFYGALGWRVNWEVGGLAELELGGCRFYLQRYYQKEWCENTMLYVTVDDAEAWYEHVKAVLTEHSFGAARVKPPEEQDYGALVTFVWDPAGVLLHFAQPLPRREEEGRD